MADHQSTHPLPLPACREGSVLLLQLTKKIIPALSVLLLFSSCSPKIYHALDWQGNKINADGRITEWPDPLRFLDEKTKISYTITNDLNKLYVCMRVADPASKAKIIHGGMEFRIDTLGKSAFPVAFIFPIANQIVMTQEKRVEFQQDDNYGGKPNRHAMNQRILSPANEFQLIGFRQPHNGTIALLNNTFGISAAITLDSLGNLCYEAIIPFSAFYKNELTAADTSRVFGYEIKINALPAPEPHEKGGGEQGMNSEGGGMGGQHHGGGGGQYGGSGGGGSHGGEHRGGGASGAGNSDMYVASQITRKMKFTVK